MKLLIDANILLDVLQKREPHYKRSAIIWKLCESDYAEGYISALTFANMVYIMRKELSSQEIDNVLNKLTLIFNITELNAMDLAKAAKMQWNDFEDAVQSATAERIHADYIVTRNIKDFVESSVPAVTPFELISKIEKQE